MRPAPRLHSVWLPGTGSGSCSPALPPASPTPVSYTHLDVYKRQVMLGAGVISGLLGIGAGAFKVLSMDHIMRLPFKVSTTTSNFMMGVTAAASAGIYLGRGYIDPGIALPVFLGTLPGALLGSRVLARADVKPLRVVFAVLVTVVAVRMIWGGSVSYTHLAYPIPPVPPEWRHSTQKTTAAGERQESRTTPRRPPGYPTYAHRAG